MSSTRPLIGTDISYAAGILQQGGLVAIPTETVYGLAANALNVHAVARVFAAKNRPAFDPLIVHIAGAGRLGEIVESVPSMARVLSQKFWPGPLTLVLPKRTVVPDLVTAGLSGVGVRVPVHPLTQQLLEVCGLPLAAPSANPFGGISPTCAEHVAEGLGSSVDYILDGGSCHIGLESTVLSLMDPVPMILRHGGLPAEDLERVIGPVRRAQPDHHKDDAAQPAPGMLSRHYAPSTRMRLIGVAEPAHVQPGMRCGLLTWGNDTAVDGFAVVENLSVAGDLNECAARLFAALRRLDQSHADLIIARMLPDEGLGVAMNDRLRRGAGREQESH